jgi:hypothetical protein
MKKLKNILSAAAIIVAFTFSNAQYATYQVGNTEYVQGQYYSTTGKPKVVRSASNKKAFLKSRGYTSTPYGYEIDHIVPLSQGGSDGPSNMQLLTITQHRAKTSRERARTASNNSYSKPLYAPSTINYYSTPSVKVKKKKYKTSTYSSPSYQAPSYSFPSSSSSTARTIHTGSRGGKYYINSNGNKSYVKRD